MAARKCLKAVMAIPILLVVFTLLVDLTRAQLNLPDMPGPPYPDRWGNNRWGVKYDPRVHGGGRGGGRQSHHQSSSASDSRPWGGEGGQENHPPRYRGGSDWSPPYSQHHNHQSSRGKWAPGLKPLVSTLSKLTLGSRHGRPKSHNSGGGGRDTSAYSTFDPTSDSFYKDAYTSKSIDGYVKNYMDTYSTVAETPSGSSDLANIKNFARPLDLSNKFRPKTLRKRPSHVSSDGSSTSFVHTSRISKRDYSSSSTSSSKPSYRTFNPQTDFFGPSKSTNRNFATTLSNIYNDYKPGAENTISGLNNGNGGGSSSSSSYSSNNNNAAAAAASDSNSKSLVVTVEEIDMYPPHSYSPSRPSSPQKYPESRHRSRPRPSAVRSSGKGSSYYSKRQRRPRLPPPGKGRPLSALDQHEETLNGGYSFSGPDYSTDPMHSNGDGPTYSSGSSGSWDGPNIYSSGAHSPPSYSTNDGGPSYPYSSDGPSYSEPGPYNRPFPPAGPPSSHYDYPYNDNYGHGPPGPMSHGPALPPHSPVGLNYIPPSEQYYSPPSYPPHKRKPKRKNKNRSQHTPMNILRGLLGRGDRDSKRAYANLPEHSAPLQPHPYAITPHRGYPQPLPHIIPRSHEYNPLLNSLSGGLDFMDRPREPLLPRPHPPNSPFSLLSGLTRGLRERQPPRHHPFQGMSGPPAPPRSRLPPRPSTDEHEEGEEINGEQQQRDPRDPKEYKTAYNNWPRIFTAVGSTVDAVAGGIHAARKEVSKMTGEAVAKGIMMGGTAVHEVSKGMATVITKMSAI
ncbi:hypothetical protein Ocin01_04262 [Orchesella cincta]|uniref:Uncharacterized protein n=1 Tax=Orchesella cincta TaxID=48709 RepID=A0A1D2NB01_ORCCI|nr:hypothetical protein Ocin01_04262 [Orchesella cincta]